MVVKISRIWKRVRGPGRKSWPLQKVIMRVHGNKGTTPCWFTWRARTIKLTERRKKRKKEKTEKGDKRSPLN